MTPPAPHPELRALVDRLLDEGPLSRTEMARLEELLDVPDNLAYYLSITTGEALMPEALAGVQPAAPAAKAAPNKKRTIAWIGALAATACVMFATGLFLGRLEPVPMAQKPPTLPPARITGLVGVEWESGKEPDLVSADGSAQRLAFRTGLAELTYGNGVRVTLEGPADFSITGPNAARLDRGRLVAAVPKGAEGFSVDYSGGKVVDLGTEFGLETMGTGAAELGVFDGEVELHRPGNEVLSLVKNQSVLIDQADQESPVTAIPLDRKKFVRRIPTRDFRWEVTKLEPTQVEFDVSHLVWKAANYRALFKWMQGPDALQISNVTLCLDGKPVNVNTTTGTTGHLKHVRDNLFELPLPKDQFQRGKWTIRATLQPIERADIFKKNNTPIHSLGILQFEEGLASKATASDFIGTWSYRYAGEKYERRINSDGTITFFRNGKVEPGGFPGGTWAVENGVLRINSPKEGLHEDHVLRDPDTMIFVSQPYDNAVKVKKP